MEDSRATPFSFLAQILNNTEHLFAASVTIDHFARHAHRDLFSSIGTQKAFNQEMSHEKTDKDAAVATVFLLRAVLEVDES